MKNNLKLNRRSFVGNLSMIGMGSSAMFLPQTSFAKHQTLEII